jgi:hypothetical protein
MQLRYDNNTWAFVVFYTIEAVIALIALSFVRETADRPLAS